ncbi:hypothetical protein HW555_000443 [Spodoptera exigua]|uniref:PiggyBac transposable element-derived protein domain-containing protein n=1 Tax=Spodoptera exigua TaxID=7107 RepID=A0A835GS48_SPOEX|nr:hypothetical protein HW555_000443 [Spodoptera exigua]
MKMPRKLSNEALRRVLEESDFELSDDDTNSNGANSDVHNEEDSDILDQEPSIFADDDVDDPDFDPGEISRSNIVTDDFSRDSPANNSSDIVINSPRPETSRRRTAGEIMRLAPQEINDIDKEHGWSQEILPLSRQPYNSNPTLHIQGEQSAVSIYRRILTNEVLDLMNVNMSVHSRMTRWTDVTCEEMMKFIGLYMLMGIVKFPTFESCWKLDPIYYHQIFHNVNISYNRFSSILRCWHFVDNEAPRDRNERLYKIKPLLDLVINNWKSLLTLTPDECIVIDESMVPFRGRISFRQYNPSKAHKYGSKIYKLCTEEGFLCDGLLDAGRIIVCDNYYNTVGLAKFLQQRKTDLCGTLRVNRKELPWAIRSKKMGPKKKDNIIVMKWRDKRDVAMISTCHDTSMQMSLGYQPKLKPKAVLYYNERKKGIDVSDQLSSYYDPKRKSLAWYKKIALDVLICASVTNTSLLYQKLHSTSNRKLRKTVLQTQQEIIREFLQLNNASDASANTLTNSPRPSTSSIASQHFLTKVPPKRQQNCQKTMPWMLRRLAKRRYKLENCCKKSKTSGY